MMIFATRQALFLRDYYKYGIIGAFCSSFCTTVCCVNLRFSSFFSLWSELVKTLSQIGIPVFLLQIHVTAGLNNIFVSFVHDALTGVS